MKNWFLPILPLLILSFAVPVWAAELTPGLVVYLRFEGNANDSSGNGNNGSLGGGGAEPTLATGQSGQAYSFDGGDIITVADSATLDSATGAGQARTILFRFKDTIDANTVMVEKGTNKHFVIQTKPGANTGKIGWRVEVGGGNDILSLGSSFNDDAWHRLMAVFTSGSNAILYIDGASEGSDPNQVGPADDNDAFVIGARAGPIGGYTGTIDELLIYNRAVPEGEGRQIIMGFLHGGM